MSQKKEKIIGLVKIVVDGRLKNQFLKQIKLIPDKEGELREFIKGNNGRYIHPHLLSSALETGRYHGKDVEVKVITQISGGYLTHKI